MSETDDSRADGTRTELARDNNYTHSDFDTILLLSDGTLVAKHGRYWYRIEHVLSSDDARYTIVTTPEPEPWEAAMLDMPDSPGTTDGAKPADGPVDCSHHGLVEIDAVLKGDARVDGQATILKLGAAYYKNRATYGPGTKTVLQALKSGVVVTEG